jgi:hypothetical protein
MFGQINHRGRSLVMRLERRFDLAASTSEAGGVDNFKYLLRAG